MAQNPIAAILFREKSAEWTTLKPVKTGFEVDEHRTAEIAVEGTGLNFSAPETAAAVKIACGHIKGDLCAALPADKTLMRVVDLPTSDPAEMKGMADLQVDKFSPFPVEHMTVALEVLSQKEKSSRVLIVAVQREIVETFGATLKSAGLLPHWIDVQVMGWWYLLKERGAIPDKGRKVLLLLERTGAELIVTGTVDLSGADLRLQARVVEASSGRVLYAVEPATGPRADPMNAIQGIWHMVRDTIAARLLAEIELAGEESRPPRFEACQEFAAAREPGTPAAARLAHCRKAVELDPEFFTARLILVELLRDTNSREEAAAELDALEARRARLTPVQQMDLRVERAFFLGRYEDALVAERELVRLFPSRADHRVFVDEFALRTNRPREAVEHLTRPLPWGTGRRARQRLVFLCRAYHLLGEYAHELDAAREAIALSPNAQVPRWHEAGALVALGRIAEAEQRVRAVLPTATNPVLAATAFYYGASELLAHGHGAEAARLAAEGVAWVSSQIPEKDRQAQNTVIALPDLLCIAGRFREAQVLLDAAVLPRRKTYEASGRWDHAGLLARRAIVAVKLGDEAAARRDAEELARIEKPYTLGDISFCRGVVAAHLGQKDGAVALLRRSVAEGYEATWPYAIWFHQFHGLAPLRGYPPFEELLRPKG